ncbi:MAG: diaminopimelate epimerase [Dehalococcoidia bacterium]
MIPFAKAHGTGNDFVLFEAEHCPGVIRDPAFIQRVCNRHTGVGSDGLLILSADSDCDFRLDYYNADGSWETFCANGSRCAVRYFYDQYPNSGEIHFIAGDGPHDAAVLPDGRVRLQIQAPRHVTEMLEVHGYRGQHVDSGAPHFAIEVPEVSEELVAQVAAVIRYDAIFQPRGVNVNFFQRLGPDAIKVITYEKGVEDVMRSCASGSTAACYQAAMTGSLTSPVRVINPGGELQVDFDSDWRQVTVTGSVVIVFEAHLPDDF